MPWSKNATHITRTNTSVPNWPHFQRFCPQHSARVPASVPFQELCPGVGSATTRVGSWEATRDDELDGWEDVDEPITAQDFGDEWNSLRISPASRFRDDNAYVPAGLSGQDLCTSVEGADRRVGSWKITRDDGSDDWEDIDEPIATEDFGDEWESLSAKMDRMTKLIEELQENTAYYERRADHLQKSTEQNKRILTARKKKRKARAERLFRPVITEEFREQLLQDVEENTMVTDNGWSGSEFRITLSLYVREDLVSECSEFDSIGYRIVRDECRYIKPLFPG
jgi:hypothetical protein